MPIEGIDVEEFERRKRDKSTTPTEERTRCPDCDGLDFRPRKPNDSRGPNTDTDANYYCEACRAFSDPE